MKLLAVATTAVTLGLLTTGCSGGSGSKAGSSVAAGVTSATGAAAPSAGAPATSVTGGAPPSAAGASVTAPSAVVSSAGTPTGSPTTATTGGKTALAVCATLPTSQVASLSGLALTLSREQDFAVLNSYTCSYYTASGFGGTSVTVKTVGGATAYTNTLNTDTIAGAAEHATPMSGLGDKAFSARDGIHVLFGDRLITVAGLTSVQPAEAIVKALQAKLN
jgi:hypothetical protein